jgi:hypothetical protein
LLEKRRRNAQRGGDVVEAVHLDLRRKQRLGVELDAKQIVHRRGKLSTCQPLNRYMSRLRLRASARQAGCGALLGSVKRRFHPCNERVDLFLVGLPASRRRHQTSTQLAKCFLPDVGVLLNGACPKRIRGVDAHCVQGQASSLGL